MAEHPGPGERIKRLRQEKDLTLREIEAKAKVSATHISEIERGLTSPTVGALTRIAAAMGVSPSSFLRTNDAFGVRVTRRDGRRRWSDAGTGMTIAALGDGTRNAALSTLEVSIAVGGAGVVPARVEGESIVYVVRGVAELHVGDTRHILQAGDTVHFMSRPGHHLRNIGDGEVRIVWATTPEATI